MLTSYYGTFAYGSLTTYGAGIGSDTPALLSYHYNENSEIYTFYWAINSSFITPSLKIIDWELEISTTETFDAGTVTTYTKGTAFNFYDGDCVKAYDIDGMVRQYGASQTLFARVRTVYGTNHSAYTPIIPFTIYQNYREVLAEEMLVNIPDQHVYNKDLLSLPYLERESNLYNIFRMYAEQLDFCKMSIVKNKLDKYLEIGRDESLYDNFGAYFDFPKPTAMTYAQYRIVLKAVFESITLFGTNYALQRIITAFTGLYPTIENIRDTASFYVYDDVMYQIVNVPLQWTRRYGYYEPTEYVIAVDVTSDKDEGYTAPVGEFIGECRIVNNWSSFPDDAIVQWSGAEWVNIGTLTTGQKFALQIVKTGSSFVGHDGEIATWTGATFTYSGALTDGYTVTVRRQNNQLAIQQGTYLGTNSRYYNATSSEWEKYDGITVPTHNVVSISLKGDSDQGGVTPSVVSTGDCWIVNNWGDDYVDGSICEYSGTTWRVLGTLESGDSFKVIDSGAEGSFAGNEKAIAVYNGSWSFTAPISDQVITLVGKEKPSILQVTAPVVYDRNAMAFGIRIILHNPGEFDIDIDSIKHLISKAIPIHVYWELIYER